MSSAPSTPNRPSADGDEHDTSTPASPPASLTSSPASRDGRTLEERTMSMDYDAHYHYKDAHSGKHYNGKHHRTSPSTSNSNLAALKDKIADTMHVPDHAPHLVPTAADHRSRYLPGVLYVPMLIVRWLAHPFRLLMGTAEDSDGEVHVHHHSHGNTTGGGGGGGGGSGSGSGGSDHR